MNIGRLSRVKTSGLSGVDCMLLEGLFACAVAVEDYGCFFDDLAALLVPCFGVLSLLGDLFGGCLGF